WLSGTPHFVTELVHVPLQSLHHTFGRRSEPLAELARVFLYSPHPSCALAYVIAKTLVALGLAQHAFVSAPHRLLGMAHQEHVGTGAQCLDGRILERAALACLGHLRDQSLCCITGLGS